MGEMSICVEACTRASFVASGGLEAVEIDGDLVGFLTRDHADHSFRFRSGVAPYDLLDGSRFSSPALANQAVRRIAHAANGGPRVKARGLDEKNRSHCSSGAT